MTPFTSNESEMEFDLCFHESRSQWHSSWYDEGQCGRRGDAQNVQYIHSKFDYITGQTRVISGKTRFGPHHIESRSGSEVIYTEQKSHCTTI